MEKKICCITGMHRSGTSMLTNWLEKCGLELFSKLGGGVGNIDGHFEDKDFLRFHEELITEKSTYNKSRGWKVIKKWNCDFSDNEKEIAKKLIGSRINQSSSHWGWKDPRTSLFLNEWKQLTPNLYTILLWRPHKQVVDSLVRRSNKVKKENIKYITFEEAYKIWFFYNSAILDYFKKNKESSILVSLSDVIENDKSFFDLLQAKFHLDLAYKPLKETYNYLLLKKNDSNSLIFNIRYFIYDSIYNFRKIEQELKNNSIQF